jgi:hypothetical protein
MRAIAVVVTLLALISGAKAQTLGELTQECEQLESFWRSYPPTEGTISLPQRADAAMCFGYMQAIIGLRTSIGLPTLPGDPERKCFYTAEGKFGGGAMCRVTLGICYPKGVRANQVLAVFLAYARSHAAQWHEAAASHFRLSLMAAFPCDNQYVE